MSDASISDLVADGLDEAAGILDRAGVVVLREYLPVRLLEAVQGRVWDLVAHLYGRFGSGHYDLTDRSDAALLDAALIELYRTNPRYESFVYDTSRHLPEITAALDCREVLDAIRAVLRVGAGHPIAINNRNVRIDLPGENWNENLPWHQDYPYQNPLYTPGRSMATWIPVFPCPLALGPAVFKVGSHQAGEVSTLPHSFGENRTTAWTIPEEHLGSARYADWQGDLGVGDLVIFTLTTIHRSGINRSESRVRWSMQSRCHDVVSDTFTGRYDFARR